MASIVYLLCALASSFCAWLLLSNFRRSESKLLLWSGLCFLGFALSNIILFIDLVLTAPSVDLSIVRTVPALVGVYLLVWGLIWESV